MWFPANWFTIRVMTVILLVAALVCFILAALGVKARVNLIALGLACWILPSVIAAF